MIRSDDAVQEEVDEGAMSRIEEVEESHDEEELELKRFLVRRCIGGGYRHCDRR
jgi:hypothetical protein